MRKVCVLILILLRFIFSTPLAQAQENNKFGVHILDASEAPSAATLVNSNGGDWGYVTIPIRANDRDLKKWQKFMDDCRKFHLIPILRLASIPVGSIWQKPDFDEVIDFSNFLSDLNWPVKTRYVIAYNEPNHSQEWGNTVNPAEYGRILSFALSRFKLLNSDFFVLPAALDASVPDSKSSISEFRFLKQMFSSEPALSKKIQAINSHSYPNPNFSASPSKLDKNSIATFRYERDYFRKLTGNNLPVFITETGWQMETLSPDLVSNYYRQAFSTAWSDPGIIAITPFLLRAGGEFFRFSLTGADGKLTPPGLSILAIPKTAGRPVQSEQRPSSVNKPEASINNNPGSWIEKPILSLKDFLYSIRQLRNSGKISRSLSIKDISVKVELADTSVQRELGLSGRGNLEENSGMLFVFTSSDKHTFWMKDMNFPLDFIWINQGKIVQIDKDVPRPTKGKAPVVIKPTTPVNWVLEVNAGFTQNHSLVVGDIVELD